MNIEILAPAGSMESLVAAVRCGANSVYVGGTSFSARQNASNFTKDELKEAVEFCHLHGVKIHLAVNTVVFDTQLADVENTILFAAEIGIDAIIVQDLGVLRMIKKLVPDMPVHASTQMSLHTPGGAIFAKNLGFDRVVLSRELSAKQISKITGLGIETEVFVHGALCMSVSGQCYMSSVIGSRSANRGLCGGACRLPFSACSGSDSHALSLKDLCLVNNITQLAKSGVTSLKIEGRMKRPEYVAASVTAFRAASDGLIPDITTLQSVFSRSGFTNGYFENTLNSSMFGIREKEDVIAAQEVLPSLKDLYRKEKKSAIINFSIKINSGKPAELSVYDSDGNSAKVYGAIPEKAENRPTDIDQIKKQFSKLGDTIYDIGSVEGEIEESLILTSASLNALRREAVDTINSVRIVNNTPKYTICKDSFPLEFPKTLNIKPKSMRLQIEKLSQLENINVDDVELIILPIREIINNKQAAEKYKNKIALTLPRFLPDCEEEFEEILQELKPLGYNKLYCTNLSHIQSGLKLGYLCYGGIGLNITNSAALEQLAELGAVDATVSFEMKLTQISHLADYIPYGAVLYGRLPLMLTRNCPIKQAVKACSECTGHLTDRTGRTFPVICDGYSSEILNCDILYMADRISEANNISFYILKFIDESPQQIKQIIDCYNNKSKPIIEEYTRGLYYRGII